MFLLVQISSFQTAKITNCLEFSFQIQNNVTEVRGALTLQIRVCTVVVEALAAPAVVVTHLVGF